MDYGIKTNETYKIGQQQTATPQSRESALEKIAKSGTKMKTGTSGNYNIDKCNCGNCGCVQGNLLLVLSPVGIAGTVSAFGPISASD